MSDTRSPSPRSARHAPGSGAPSTTRRCSRPPRPHASRAPRSGRRSATAGCTSRLSISRRPGRSSRGRRSRGSRRSPPPSAAGARSRSPPANAGQAYAWAGREAGVPVTVVMPAAPCRRRSPRASRTARTSSSTATTWARRLSGSRRSGPSAASSSSTRTTTQRSSSATVVRPRDPRDLPDVDVVVVAVGGGGLIGGVTVALKESRRRIRVTAWSRSGPTRCDAGSPQANPSA